MSVPALPPALAGSPLRARGGWRRLDRLLERPVWEALRAEADARRPHAVRTESTAADDEEVRGGDPPRAFSSATGGELQDALYATPELHDRLARELGASVAPTGERGTYSYYEEPGDHLGLHRDVSGCDVSLVTCLRDRGRPEDAVGAVCVWPDRMAEPLSAIRARPERGRVFLRLAPGETLLLLGGYLPHALLPVAAGQERVASVLCFRIEV